MMFPVFRNDYDTTRRERSMAADVMEYEKGYEICLELPGCKKENVEAQLKNGYLTITADVKAGDGRYIRRERRAGRTARSFYVGDRLTKEDITARFDNGLLRISVPKESAHPEIRERHLVNIEG